MDTTKAYDEYLDQHRKNVIKAFKWLIINVGYMFPESIQADPNPLKQLIYRHDLSKYSSDEYEPYKNYFFGGYKECIGKTYQDVKDAFDKAWLHHIHCNPHHWEHWVIVNSGKELNPLPMPEIYAIEMICDWWSFSWKADDLTEIFNWYDDHKENMVLNQKTREFVESILAEMQKKLPEQKETA